jgi:hypothetical protein
MLRLTVRFLSVLALGLGLVACDSGDDPGIPTAPTPPPMVTETFSGSVNQNGGMTHSFTTSASGTVTATLTALGPDSTATLGMSLGTLSAGGTTCQAVLTNDRSTQGTIITGGVSAFGSLCVRAYDVGTITAATPFTYEITIMHP